MDFPTIPGLCGSPQRGAIPRTAQTADHAISGSSAAQQRITIPPSPPDSRLPTRAPIQFPVLAGDRRQLPPWHRWLRTPTPLPRTAPQLGHGPRIPGKSRELETGVLGLISRAVGEGGYDPGYKRTW